MDDACRTKFGALGSGKNQFNAPHGFCLGLDDDIAVADTHNHRVQVFSVDGEFKYTFGQAGAPCTLCSTSILLDSTVEFTL